VSKRRTEPTLDAKLRDLEAELGVIRTSEPGTLETLAARLADVLRVPHAVTYSYDEREGHVRIAEGSEAGLPGVVSALDDFLAVQPPVGWTGYNPLRPDPFDRNKLRDREELARRLGGNPRVVREIFPRFGVAAHRHVRVVVCDGPSMLGYVGLFQPDSFEPRQLEGLRRLVPRLRRRLVLDRMWSAAPRTRSALLAALEAIAAPAWVVGASGAVEHANAAGQGALDDDRTRTTERLSAARQGAAVPGFEVTPLRGRGEAEAFLIVERAVTQVGGPEARIRQRIAKLGLTPRLAQAYELLARGVSNRTIAAELSISEATVVQYVTTLLDRSGVESRAALIAQLLWSKE
jgi:DNA-binding CsgD family transcriptional regulator